MNGWIILSIYLAGAVLVALRLGWHIRYRLDKYDRMFSADIRGTFWLNIIFWPLLVLKPDSLIHPKFKPKFWNEGRAEAERELDRLAQNLPPCSTTIRYAPTLDESGDCDSEFIFDAAEVEAIMAKRLAELPAEEYGRHRAILNWLRQRDSSCTEPTEVPAPWNGHFLAVAIGMMKRGLGQAKCGTCGEFIPQEQIVLDPGSPEKITTSGWSYIVWRCSQNHKLLTKDAMHFYIRSLDE